MKRAVSISIGSTQRDKQVEVELLGERVRIERIGTNGDIEKAAALYAELDGQVDAFGLGGIDLGVHTPWKMYPLHDAKRMIRHVQRTPLTDGSGLKMTLEARVMQAVEREIGAEIQPKTALLTAAITRYGMTTSFIDAGYDCVFGDLMFGLGIPIPIRGMTALRRLAKLLLPVVGRMKIEWLYPTGEKQEENVPKHEKHYQWASVIGGDFIYVKQHMPPRMDGKTIVTNTTTAADVDFLRARGVKYLITTTPVYDGRSFGTNMLEAALIAASSKGRTLTHAELSLLIDRLDLKPQIQKL